MASSSTVHAPERSKLEQIVVEFFAKSLHIILESRIPALCGEGDCLRSSASSLSSGPKTRDRWFNLALGDCTAALENFETWRRDFSDPMVVDIILDQPKSAERNPSLPRVAPFNHQHWTKGGFLPLKGTAEVSSSSVDEGTVLERWTVQFEQHKKGSPGSKGASGVKAGAGPDVKRVGSIGAGEVQEMRTDSKELWSGSGSGSRSQKTRIEIGESAARGGGSILPTHVTEVPAVYKRTVVMLRSLYSKCRLLPAYRLFRLSNSPSNCCNFSLSYRVLSSATPLSEHDKRDMRDYSFTPVETAYGRMRLSVAYRHTTAVIAMEVAPSIRPRIIPDYVGSPTTDPLKRFTGEPHSLPSSGMPINRGIHIVSVPSSLQNSPPGLGLGRRHSWSGRINQIQPALQPPSSPSYRISRSPSPSHPFHPSPPYLPSPYSPFSQKHPSSDLSLSPLSSPVSSADGLSVLHPAIFTKHVSPSQPISIDNRCSPPFLSSPSPSPPTLYPGSQPVSIPKPCHSRGSKFPTGDIHQRSRNSLPPLSPSARKTGPLFRSSSESPRYSAQLLSHAHQSRSFESPLQLHVLHDDHGQQVWRNEGSGPFSAENIFSGQSQETLSRSSSKTALGDRDDGEDEDFSCPFAVDDMDAGEKRSSKSDNVGPRGEIPESSFGTLQQRSQDAAVGALIRMLKSAPPLRHSFYPAMETTDSSLAFGANERELMSRSPTCLVPERMMGRVQDVLLEPLSTMHITKTLKDALGEFQLYKNMRDAMHMHRGGEEVGHTLIGSSMLPG